MPKTVGESPNSVSKMEIKRDASPRKSWTKSHTVHNEDKLKVFIKLKQPAENSQTNNVLKVLNDYELQVHTALKSKIYSFDRVFDNNCTSSAVFNLGCRQLIDGVFADVDRKRPSSNGLIFVYGNTGTGKTYTMGLLSSLEQNSAGIVPQALQYIFALKRKSSEVSSIAISFCEIYMQEIYDLLDFQFDTKLTIRQNSKNRQPFLQNQIVISVSSVTQAFELINIGLEKRKIAQQKMNGKSSRGHGLITIHLNCKKGQVIGKLCFIDLAGSERLKDTESQGCTLNQALHINSSLSSLETLLMNISDQNVRNYRGSKLTRLLQPYIERGKIQLFVTSNYDNLQSIQFGKRCKGIKFMQRQVKVSVSPKKMDATSKHQSKTDKIDHSSLRKESSAREKNLLYCITHLIGMINKISQSLKETLEAQIGQTYYTFSDVMNNGDIQESINAKINSWQSKEQDYLQQDVFKFNSGHFLSSSEEIAGIFHSPTDFINRMHTSTFTILQSMKNLGSFSSHKNIYKEKYFMSELKARLLETKNNSFEEMLNYLLKLDSIAGNEKKIQRKMRNLGVIIPTCPIKNVTSNASTGIAGLASQTRKINNGWSKAPKGKQMLRQILPCQQLHSTQNSPLNNQKQTNGGKIFMTRSMVSRPSMNSKVDSDKKRLIYIQQQ